MNMDKNEKERKLLGEWAVSNYAGSSFLYEPHTESCFIKRGQDEKYIWEYDFESVPEIRNLLEEQWKEDKEMEKILTVVLAAMIKNKPKPKKGGCEECPEQNVYEDAEALPMYIYNF